MPEHEQSTFLAVVGAGPAGYPAAFHAADLGMQVVLIDREPHPGGVCLYRGCIPSKAILHAARSITLAAESAEMGITMGTPRIDLDKLRAWKQGVVDRLTSGLGQITAQRGITYLRGTAEFIDQTHLRVRQADGSEQTIRFEHAIVATGSEPVTLPFLPTSDRIMDSTTALALERIPKSLLVIGGGYIGLELGQAYAALGTRVSVVETLPYLLAGVDRDLAKPLTARLNDQFERISLKTKVTAVTAESDGLTVHFEGDAPGEARYEAILAAVGRRPVTRGLGLERAGVTVDAQGFITVDAQRRTTNPAIQAVGDAAGQPMLAHKATHEGRAAVEALHDGKTIYQPQAIPAVVFTDPEIAWCGLTEDEARRAGRNVRVGSFPWQASGRAATLGRVRGLSKVIADADDGRVLGVGISGENAGELIAEGVLAMEMGAVAEDLALTIHPHPTLSETLMEAAERTLRPGSTHYFQRQ